MVNVIIDIGAIVPLILFFITIILLFKSRKYRNYLDCKGTIVDFYTIKSNARLAEVAYKKISPVISYKVDNREYTFKSNYGRSSMKIGDIVNVKYNRENPESAVIKEGIDFAIIITAVLCMFFSLAWGIVFFITSK